MITITNVEINGRTFRRTVSDKYAIHKIGSDEIYDEAIDVLDSPFVYEETNEPLSEKTPITEQNNEFVLNKSFK